MKSYLALAVSGLAKLLFFDATLEFHEISKHKSRKTLRWLAETCICFYCSLYIVVYLSVSIKNIKKMIKMQLCRKKRIHTSVYGCKRTL